MQLYAFLQCTSIWASKTQYHKYPEKANIKEEKAAGKHLFRKLVKYLHTFFSSPQYSLSCVVTEVSFTSSCRQYFSCRQFNPFCKQQATHKLQLHWCQLNCTCLWCEVGTAYQLEAASPSFDRVPILYQRGKINGKNGMWPADLNQHFHCNEDCPRSFRGCKWRGAALQPDPLSDSLVREGLQHLDHKFVRSSVVSYRLLPAFSSVKGGV